MALRPGASARSSASTSRRTTRIFTTSSPTLNVADDGPDHARPGHDRAAQSAAGATRSTATRASDFVFGGTDLDWIYGDDGDVWRGTDATGGNDLLFGDHGRIYPQFSALNDFNSRNFFAIDTGDGDGGEGDRMCGEEGDDSMLGQQGDDRMWGGSGDDDMTGGHNVSGGYDELTLARRSRRR